MYVRCDAVATSLIPIPILIFMAQCTHYRHSIGVADATRSQLRLGLHVLSLLQGFTKFSRMHEPQCTPGALHLNSNPRNGNSYFNTSLFSLQPLGTPSNARRRFFCG